jgi:hypothetical protein
MHFVPVFAFVKRWDILVGREALIEKVREKKRRIGYHILYSIVLLFIVFDL